jgi:hypothetical protein
MTAVMRAMATATGPKVLRIGLVASGRIVEERIVKQRTSVTIGPSEKSMFVIQAPSIPPNFKLFELIGADYYLNFLDGMTGRVALQTGITDLGALKGQARRAGNAYQVKLTEDARGKVVVGETTFLFQFVAPPPVQPRPQLPLAVKGGVGSQIDWNLTTIAAFSLLLHFGLVFSFYTSSLFPWADPLYTGDDDSVVALLQHQQDIAPPPPVETAEPEPTATATSTADEKTPEKKPAQQQSNQGQSQQKPGQQDPTKAAQLTQQAEDAKIAIMAALGGGPASKDVLKDDNGAPVNMNGLKDGSGGVSNANNNGLNLTPSGGGPLGTKGGGNLQDIKGGPAGGGGGDVAGPTTRPVVGNVSGGGVSASVPVQNADAVIRSGLHPRARACYNAGLKEDPNQQGRVVVTIVVGPSGDVTSASAAQCSGLSPKTCACIAGGARNLKFQPPGGGGSTINAPMNFVKQ